eukprot:RCo011975
MAVNPTVAALRKASLPAALLRAGSASADQLLCGSEQLSPSSLSPVDKREGEGGGGEGTPRAGRFEGGAEVPPEQPLQGVLPDVLPPEDLPELLRRDPSPWSAGFVDVPRVSLCASASPWTA